MRKPSIPALYAIVWLIPLQCILGVTATAGDWPQILGPNRSGEAREETLLAKWPTAGPEVAWTHNIGEGYAGVAVSGDKVVAFHRVGEKNVVEALKAENGQQLWKIKLDALYRGGINADRGPRCVPLIHKDRIVLYSPAGDLHCLSLDDGKTFWSRSLYADYRGDEGYFGAGSTPVIVQDKVIVNVGGRADAGLVALDLASGKTVWKKTDERASYAAPTVATVAGKSHAIFVTRMNCVSVDPANGDVRFRFPFGKRGPTVNAATPLVFDDHLFVSASYGVGAVFAKLGADEPQVVWSNDDVMSQQFTTCVHHEGFLYGTDGREDIGVGTLRCIEAKTGKVQWSVDGFGIAHVILADGKLLIQHVDGQLTLAQADSTKFTKLAGARVSSDSTRALPALSNGRLFVRDNSGTGGKLRCFVVGR